MKPIDETTTANNTPMTIDVSLLAKTEGSYFNATKMAKHFGKRPNDWLSLPDTKAYIDAWIEVRLSDQDAPSGGDKKLAYEQMVRTKTGGKNQGTWLHVDLRSEFARWLSPVFAVRLDRLIMGMLEQERDRQQNRAEAKTGFPPMTDAVHHAFDLVNSRHTTKEADMINRIVLGMTAKEFRLKHGAECVCDALDEAQRSEINDLQHINFALIEFGEGFHERKEKLIDYHHRRLLNPGLAD